MVGSLRLSGAAVTPANASAHLEQLATDHWARYLAHQPVAATLYLGRAEHAAAFGPDISPAGRARRRAELRGLLKRVAGIEAGALTPDERLTAELLTYQIEAELAADAFPQWLMPFNHYSNPLLLFAQEIGRASPQTLNTPEAVAAFNQRCLAAAAWIDQAIANFREGIEQGVTLPRPLAQRAVQALAPLAAPEPAGGFYRGAVAAAEAVGEPLAASTHAAIHQQLQPAAERLHRFLQAEYLPAARTTLGWNQLPQGSAWYEERIRFHTTTALTADAIHARGLELVAATLHEMEQVQEAVGFHGTRAQFYQQLAADRRLFADSPDDLLAWHRTIGERIAPAVDRLFVRRPLAPLEIRPIEPFRQAGAPGAQYYPPAAGDGSQPGIFYLNTRNLDEHPRHEAEALFLHEAIPGHHFQMSLAAELSGVPEFRRRLFVTAFIEGWGLYAESLGRELGLYQDPLSWFGRLRYDLFRSARLVVDTGLHAQGWTREQAIQYLRDHLPMTESALTSEVDRYLADPGQALAYKLGELELRRLRTEAEGALGPRFNLPAFHAEVLRYGALPLDVLERRVHAWVQTTQAPQPVAERE